jgi:hypothetical protein
LEASNASGVDLIGDFGVSAAMGEEEQSSIMSDTSNIVNYSTPSPSMSSTLLLSPQDRPLNPDCNQVPILRASVLADTFLISRPITLQAETV